MESNSVSQSSPTEASRAEAREDTPALRQRAARALAPFGFYDSTKGEMVDAYLEAPDGVDEVIRDAVDSATRGKLRTTPASVIVAAIRRGEHLRHELNRSQPVARKTGYRIVYGVGHAALTYLEDPEGTDPLPESYDLVTRNPHVPGEWRDAEREVERSSRRTQEEIDEEERRARDREREEARA